MASYGTMPELEPKEQGLELAAPYVAEFVGTFMLVFTVGVCSVVGTPVWNATAIATMLMVMIYGLGPISGGHFNPSVSVACGLAGKSPWRRVAAYVVVQVCAGLLAGWVYWLTFHQAAAVAPKNGFGWFHVGVAELLYTAMLAFVHLNCATSIRNNPEDDQNHFFGLAIGFVLVAGGYAAGNISGALLNPAVTLGLDVTCHGRTGDNGHFWRLQYLGYQLLGAGLAAVLFHLCRFREDLGGQGRGRCLQVMVLAAHNLTNRDSGFMGDVSDPYVTVRVGLEEFRTPTINNNLSPVWTTGNVFTFNLGGMGSQVDQPSLLSLEVMNSNTVLKEQSLGTLTVDIIGTPIGDWYRKRERLLGGRDGELEFAVRMVGAAADYEPSSLCRIFSEFLGAFMIVLTVGLNVVTKSPATAWSAAAAIMSMIYSLGNVSGGHFNPAVTVGCVLSGRGVCPPLQGVAYILAQLSAGVLAGLLVSDYHWAGPYRHDAFGLGPGTSQHHGQPYTWCSVFAVELAFTFMIAFVVLAVATTKPPQALSAQNFQFALAIGSCVTAGGFAVGPVSGGELNPAVSFGLATANSANFGSAVASTPWSNCLAFSAFELLGGVVAAIIFRGTHRTEFGKAAGFLF